MSGKNSFQFFPLIEISCNLVMVSGIVIFFLCFPRSFLCLCLCLSLYAVTFLSVSLLLPVSVFPLVNCSHVLLFLSLHWYLSCSLISALCKHSNCPLCLLHLGSTNFDLFAFLILHCIDSTGCCMYSSKILVHIDMILSQICRFIRCTSVMKISHPIPFQGATLD